MVEGAKKSRSFKRVQVRVPSGVSVQRYRRARPSKPTCPTGRELPGTARGTTTEVRGMAKTERRPSRPYGGVLSSPAMRDVMRERALALAEESPVAVGSAYSPGTVCVKLAGRDAGKLCVITEKLDAHFVKVDGFTRPRKVSVKHLEPTGKVVDVSGAKDSKAVQALLA